MLVSLAVANAPAAVKNQIAPGMVPNEKIPSTTAMTAMRLKIIDRVVAGWWSRSFA
jgi:hypothetical protein